MFIDDEKQPEDLAEQPEHCGGRWDSGAGRHAWIGREWAGPDCHELVKKAPETLLQPGLQPVSLGLTGFSHRSRAFTLFFGQELGG